MAPVRGLADEARRGASHGERGSAVRGSREQHGSLGGSAGRRQGGAERRTWPAQADAGAQGERARLRPEATGRELRLEEVAEGATVRTVGTGGCTPCRYGRASEKSGA